MNAPDAIRPLSKQRLRLWLKLLRTTRMVEGRLRRSLRRDHATTLPRFDVLSALERNPDGLTMSELSRLLVVSNGNVTGIVDRLVGDGLVDRATVAGDKRATRVRLTAAGRTGFAGMARAHEALIDEILAGLSAEETSAAIAMLDKLRRRNEA